MVSAYAAAFGATGDEAYREKAVALLKRAREAFGVGPKLRVFSKEAPDSIGAGRAFLYALALQAVLDVAAITSDDQWLVWSEDLATTAAEMFTGNGFLKECPDEAKLIDLPVTDLVMLFDDSTAGLVSSAESRLAELGRPLVAEFQRTRHADADLCAGPADSSYRPSARHSRPPLPGDRRQRSRPVPGHENRHRAASHALDPKRAPGRPEDQVPAGSVKVLLSEGMNRIVATPEALQEAVLPSPAK